MEQCEMWNIHVECAQHQKQRNTLQNITISQTLGLSLTLTLTITLYFILNPNVIPIPHLRNAECVKFLCVHYPCYIRLKLWQMLIDFQNFFTVRINKKFTTKSL